MTLLEAIPEGALVALDTVAWIYEVEAHPVFGPVVNSFFQERLATGKNDAGSSLLALGELLVQPLAKGDKDLADRYRSYFVPSEDWQVWEVTRDVIERAAELRALYRLKMIDALHVSSALVNNAQLFVSNDEGLRRVKEIQVLILSDFVPTP